MIPGVNDDGFVKNPELDEIQRLRKKSSAGKAQGDRFKPVP
jgi:hypothetical protein